MRQTLICISFSGLSIVTFSVVDHASEFLSISALFEFGFLRFLVCTNADVQWLLFDFHRNYCFPSKHTTSLPYGNLWPPGGFATYGDAMSWT